MACGGRCMLSTEVTAHTRAIAVPAALCASKAHAPPHHTTNYVHLLHHLVTTTTCTSGRTTLTCSSTRLARWVVRHRMGAGPCTSEVSNGGNFVMGSGRWLATPAYMPATTLLCWPLPLPFQVFTCRQVGQLKPQQTPAPHYRRRVRSRVAYHARITEPCLTALPLRQRTVCPLYGMWITLEYTPVLACIWLRRKPNTHFHLALACWQAFARCIAGGEPSMALAEAALQVSAEDDAIGGWVRVHTWELAGA